MNSKIFFIILLALSGLIIFGFTAEIDREVSIVASPAMLPQTKSMGAVEVQVTPKNIELGKDFVLQLSLDTHSVDLDYDYTQIATLIDGQGNKYKPSKWTGGNSGHHLEGELVFAALPQNSKELTFTLNGIDNEIESFIWQL